MNKLASVSKISRDGISPAEWQARVDLAAVYRLTAHYGWDDVIYNHSSMRVPDEPRKLLMKKHDLLPHRSDRLQSCQSIDGRGPRDLRRRASTGPVSTLHWWRTGCEA